MIHRFSSIAFLLFLGLSLGNTGCKKSTETKNLPSPTPTNSTPSVKDCYGERLKLPHFPKRIVVAGTPLYMEVLLDLKARTRIVGITDSTDNPPEVRTVPSVGRPWPLNLEKVIAHKPDLVLGTMGRFRSKLQSVGIPVFCGGQKGGALKRVEDIYQLTHNLDILLYGNTKRSNALVKKLKKKLTLLQNSARLRKRTRAAIVYLTRPQGQRLYIEGKGGLGDDLLKRAGGNNVFGLLTRQAVSLELLVKANPGIVITAPQHVPWVMQHKALQSLDAVRHKRVYGISAAQFTSTRLDRVVKRLMQYLHPQKTTKAIPPRRR